MMYKNSSASRIPKSSLWSLWRNSREMLNKRLTRHVQVWWSCHSTAIVVLHLVTQRRCCSCSLSLILLSTDCCHLCESMPSPTIKIKNVKGSYMYILPLTGKPEQQWFTIRSGVLTGTSSRRCGVISGRPLSEWTDFGPAVAARQTHLCPTSHTMAFIPQGSLEMTYNTSAESVEVKWRQKETIPHIMTRLQILWCSLILISILSKLSKWWPLYRHGKNLPSS